MPICPKCKAEYEEGILTCADCNTELENVTFIECENCSVRVNQLLSFCPHCGFALEESKSEDVFECDNHPNVEAVAICVVCGKPVCEECAVFENDRIFCDNDEHVKIYGDWGVVYSCGEEYEAQMVKGNIEMAGIKSLIFSQKDNVFSTNFVDPALIHVMVPKEDVAEAEKIVEKINEGDFETDITDNEDK